MTDQTREALAVLEQEMRADAARIMHDRDDPKSWERDGYYTGAEAVVRYADKLALLREAEDTPPPQFVCPQCGRADCQGLRAILKAAHATQQAALRTLRAYLLDIRNALWNKSRSPQGADEERRYQLASRVDQCASDVARLLGPEPGEK